MNFSLDPKISFLLFCNKPKIQNLNYDYNSRTGKEVRENKDIKMNAKMTGETPEVRSDKKKPRMLLRHRTS